MRTCARRSGLHGARTTVERVACAPDCPVRKYAQLEIRSLTGVGSEKAVRH